MHFNLLSQRTPLDFQNLLYHTWMFLSCTVHLLVYLSSYTELNHNMGTHSNFPYYIWFPRQNTIPTLMRSHYFWVVSLLSIMSLHYPLLCILIYWSMTFQCPLYSSSGNQPPYSWYHPSISCFHFHRSFLANSQLCLPLF